MAHDLTQRDPSVGVMSSAEAAVETLLSHGIDTVYGLPGVHNDPLFDAFHGAQNRLRVVHTRHEQGAAYMALGAALATGKPQAFSVVPGPGFLNASAAMLNAYGTNAPVIGLVGQIPQAEIDRGAGQLHEIDDQLGVARHFTKYAARINGPADAPTLVNEAVQAAISGRQRPVMLECAMDVWGKKAAVALQPPRAANPLPPIDGDAIDAAARLMGESKRAIIIVGGGALEASAEVTALAELLEAPAVAWRRGPGVVAANHRLSVSLPIAHRLWKDADLVIGIGTRMLLPLSVWGVDKALKIVRIDIDPEEPSRLLKPDHALIGDAKQVVAALLKAIPKYNLTRPRRDAELAPHRAWLDDRLSRLEPQMGYIRAMRRALPDNGILVDEVTQLGFASRLAFPVLKPRAFISPGYQDNLGWGLGTALGVKAAMPDTPVLAIAGDGGFMYQVGELATAVQHGIALVMVVFDNNSFGNVKLIQAERYGARHIACDLVNPDFVKLAEAFGVAGYRAHDAGELERSILRAFETKQPALIHVPCGPMPSPWDMIHMPRQRG